MCVRSFGEGNDDAKNGERRIGGEGEEEAEENDRSEWNTEEKGEERRERVEYTRNNVARSRARSDLTNQESILLFES